MSVEKRVGELERRRAVGHAVDDGPALTVVTVAGVGLYRDASGDVFDAAELARRFPPVPSGPAVIVLDR